MSKEQLRRIRQIKNLSQNDFAARLGYSKSYIEKVEQGQKPVTKEICESIDKLFNLERAYRQACWRYNEANIRLIKDIKRRERIKKMLFLFVIILFLLVFVY